MVDEEPGAGGPGQPVHRAIPVNADAIGRIGLGLSASRRYKHYFRVDIERIISIPAGSMESPSFTQRACACPS